MKLLQSKKAYYILLILNGMAAIVSFLMAKNTIFPDGKGYLMLAESIAHGKFSSWYFLPQYMPETLRTWGYPFFIYAINLVFKGQLAVKLAQLILYYCTVLLTLGIIKHKTNNISYSNLFLLLLLPNIQIAYYSGLIASESLGTFCTVLFIYIYLTKPLNWKNALLLALVAFADYQTRPIFILFPFGLFAYELLFKFNKTRLVNIALFLVIYGVLFLPFGYWNLKNHDYFKITPLEGGAGNAQIGYWIYKFPDGYASPPYYFGFVVSEDYLQPAFFDSIQKEKFSKDYDNEWQQINTQLAKYNTAEDTVRLNEMKSYNPVFLVQNSIYTREREKLVWQYVKRDIMADPIYYVKTRLYTFCRDWFTGISKIAFRQAHSKSQKLKLAYPFLTSFIFVFLGLIFISISFLFKKLKWKDFDSVYLLIIYFGVTNTPFTIQSRYSIPVQLLVIALLAIAILSYKKPLPTTLVQQ